MTKKSTYEEILEMYRDDVKLVESGTVITIIDNLMKVN